MQDEARRLAEQVHVLEDTRSRWNAEVAAKEASLAAKEEALAADSRQRDADQRRRLAQDHQVSVDRRNLSAKPEGKPQWQNLQARLEGRI